MNLLIIKAIANALNEHFATIGPKLAAKIPGKSKIDHLAASECNDRNNNIDQCKFHLEPVRLGSKFTTGTIGYDRKD